MSITTECVICGKEFNLDWEGYHGIGWSAHIFCFETKVGPMNKQDRIEFLKSLDEGCYERKDIDG